MDAHFWATVAIQGIGVAFFAGVYWATSRSHERRIDNVETKADKTDSDVSILYGHMDIPRPR